MATGRSNTVAAGRLGSLYSLGAAGGLTDGQLLERFLSRDDPAAAEAAFTALVDRHGALVLNVCRRELRDPHDAHDAFQATFLVLVSKASALRHWETVGGWLVGIARRVTARARVDGARRRRHLERFAAERAPLDGNPACAEADVDHAPLIDEVGRLPERFRAPVVLHYFEGLSTEATALRLGCARGTVLSRLSRARQRLKQRLERRGVAPAVLITVGGVEPARWLPPIQVPAWLAQGTIRAASSLGLAGAAIESVVPATVAKLSRRVAHTLPLSRVGVGAALLLVAAAGVSIGLAATLGQDPKPRGGPAMERPRGAMDKPPAARGDRDVKSEPLIVRGRVLDPSGEPVAGADVVLSVPKRLLDAEIRRLGPTGPDGRFEVSIPRADIEPPPGRPETLLKPAIAVESPRFGPDWSVIDVKKANDPIQLSLRRDDIPIEGRVINLEGRPVPGVSVKVGYIFACPPALLSKLRENAGKMNPELWGEMRDAFIPEGKGALRPVHTGADGRFRVTGVGRDRAAFLMIEGGPIEQSFATVFTSGDRGYRPILLPGGGPDERKLEGPRFEMAVAPGRVIEGTVRDRDTGQPIADTKIASWFGTTIPGDAQGRFRLAGQPKGGENYLTVTVEDQPYIKVRKPLSDQRGLEPVRLDIPLKRGIWAEGRVTDRATGEPVKAVVVYFPFRDNPNVNDCPDASFLNENVSDEPECPTDADGRFRAPVLPGGGLLTVRTTEPGYLAARPLDGRTAGNVQHMAGGDFQYDMDSYHALVPIEARAGKTLVVPDIALTAGPMQHIRIVGPDGRPVEGARVFCLQDASFGGYPLTRDELTFHHATPGKGEAIAFVHEGRALGAAVELRGDEPDPVRVVMQPTGSVSGRLVDEGGRPRPGVGLAVVYHLKTRGSTVGAERFEPLTSGPDGRFRIRNLVPGVSYAVEAIKKNEMNQSFRAEGYLQKTRWTVKPGETQDWGDVQVQPYRR